MSASRRSSEPAPQRESFFGDHGVTPILGAIMLLAIAIVGMAAILLWGGPAVLRIQEQGAQAAMIGEFYDLRSSSIGLSITDTSRTPGISVSQGTLSIEPGTRIEVGADMDATCRLDITEITETEVKATVTDCGTLNDASGVACGGGHTCFTVHRIDDDAPTQTAEVTPVSMSPAGPVASGGGIDVTLTFGAIDLTQGGWLVELRANGATAPTSQAWIEDTMAHHWGLRGQTEVQLHHEAGAIFSNIDTGVFLIEAPPLSEEAFDLEWFWYRMPVFSGADYSITGKLAQDVALVLESSPLRIATDDMHRMRFAFIGEYGSAWCNSLVLRDAGAPGTWSSPDACAAGADGRHVAEYIPMNAPDELEFAHAYITTSF